MRLTCRLRPACPPSLAGPKEKLDSTAVSQPAIYVASLAALEKLKAEKGEEAAAEADVAAGLSLGEYTALTYAGAGGGGLLSAVCSLCTEGPESAPGSPRWRAAQPAGSGAGGLRWGLEGRHPQPSSFLSRRHLV
jgi:hypothetical protein